jgi:hypothetical protein
MKYLLLALLVLAFPAFAVTSNLNLSKSNVNVVEGGKNDGVILRDSPLEPTKEQCTATKDAKVIAQCKKSGIAVSDTGVPSDKVNPRKK